MEEQSVNKRQSEGQTSLYRLLRLQNRENNFTFRDRELMTQFKVSYQHFPLETIAINDLLKTFWKFITTHYFKKIEEEELYRLTYFRNLFSKYRKPALPTALTTFVPLHTLSNTLNTLLDPQYLQSLFDDCQANPETRIWLKQLCLTILGQTGGKSKKTKHIVKVPKITLREKRRARGKNQRNLQLQEREGQMDILLKQIQPSLQMSVQQSLQVPKDDIEEEIARLQKLMNKHSQQNLQLVYQLQARILNEEEEFQSAQILNSKYRDAECIEGLIHSLQQKQIAQSVSKVASCERREGESRFQVLFESALNVLPQFINEKQTKRMNKLRQNSLFKFYRTGVKSTHSYICHNYAGFSDLYQNRMGLSKFKDKDYLNSMKKYTSPQLDIKLTMQQFDTCHHCKYMYPLQMLTTCRFSSERQCMPKISEGETDLGEDTSLQRGRVSQRFVSKHRNCMTGYAKISQEYICGRKFCTSCLKDCYGGDWMKRNNGICPFCEGVCSCTRCVRNQKMNKIKAFFISLGGDIAQLQSEGLVEQLPIRKDELPLRVKQKPKKVVKSSKSKIIVKQKTYQNTYSVHNMASKRRKERDADIKNMIQEQMEKWSSTAEKQLCRPGAPRRRSHRASARLY